MGQRVKDEMKDLINVHQLFQIVTAQAECYLCNLLSKFFIHVTTNDISYIDQELYCYSEK